jgi:hypothetical protein
MCGGGGYGGGGVASPPNPPPSHYLQAESSISEKATFHWFPSSSMIKYRMVFTVYGTEFCTAVSVAVPGCLFRILIFIHPTAATKRGWGKKWVVLQFLYP